MANPAAKIAAFNPLILGESRQFKLEGRWRSNIIRFPERLQLCLTGF